MLHIALAALVQVSSSLVAGQVSPSHQPAALDALLAAKDYKKLGVTIQTVSRPEDLRSDLDWLKDKMMSGETAWATMLYASSVGCFGTLSVGHPNSAQADCSNGDALCLRCNSDRRRPLRRPNSTRPSPAAADGLEPRDLAIHRVTAGNRPIDRCQTGPIARAAYGGQTRPARGC